MSRQVITSSTIDKLIAAGKRELQLDAGSLVTAYAADHARDRGFRLIPTVAGAQPPPMPGAEPIRPTRSAVKHAVIAALGMEPANLDAVLDRVLGG